MKIIKKALGIGAIILTLSGCGNDLESKKPALDSSAPLTGLEVVMRGGYSNEVLSDYQLKRLKEWYGRIDHFNRCDTNKDGVLTGKEKEKYGTPNPKYRFR